MTAENTAEFLKRLTGKEVSENGMVRLCALFVTKQKPAQ